MLSTDKERSIYALLVVLGACTLVVDTSGHGCTFTDDACHFDIDIKHYLTMTMGSDQVYLSDGKLFKYGTVNKTTTEFIDPSHVITADGHNESRVVATVNGQMPGQDIVVYEGQNITLNVHNNLIGDVLTIRVNGMPMKDMPWMDGSAFVTQCPIMPGQSFRYKYSPTKAGTYFYHAYSGLLTEIGVMGALIVRPRRSLDIPEYTMIVQSWDHDSDADKQTLNRMHGVYDGITRNNYDVMIDGTFAPYRRITSGMINGRGRWENRNAAPIPVYHVKAGFSYRFRVIGAGLADNFVISIDQHRFDMVAKDGEEFEPVYGCGVGVNSGERMDIILKADMPVGNYWIRAETYTKDKMTIYAILRYVGADDNEPTSDPTQCTPEIPCVVVNCPFKQWPQFDLLKCINVEQLRQSSQHSVIKTPAVVPGYFKEYFLNFVYHFKSPRGSVNGKSFKSPNVPPLTQPEEFMSDCNFADCSFDKVCSCSQVLTIGNNDTVQLILTNMKKGHQVTHPVHFHGHKFHVLKVGYPQYDENGTVIGHNMDIECENDNDRVLCNAPRWANQDWNYGNIPDMNTDRAALMDTVTVPAGGYVVVRIKADVPGVWAVHSAFDNHALGGMSILLNESFSKQPLPPDGFPQCRSFRSWNTTRHTSTANESPVQSVCQSDALGKSDFWKMFIIIMVVTFVQFILLVGVVCCGLKTRPCLYTLPPKYEEKYTCPSKGKLD